MMMITIMMITMTIKVSHRGVGSYGTSEYRHDGRMGTFIEEKTTFLEAAWHGEIAAATLVAYIGSSVRP